MDDKAYQINAIKSHRLKDDHYGDEDESTTKGGVVREYQRMNYYKALKGSNSDWEEGEKVSDLG